MPPFDDETAYSGEPLPARRRSAAADDPEPLPGKPLPGKSVPGKSMPGQSVPSKSLPDKPSRRARYDARDDDFDDELPRRPRADVHEYQPSGMVTSIGTVGIVFGILHLVGALVLCLTATLFAGFFVGMGQIIVNDPNGPPGAAGQQQKKAAADLCHGMGVFTGAVVLAPAIVYILAALPLVIGGWGTIKRRNWGRLMILISSPVVLLLDGASFVANPISGSIAAILALAYGIFAYIVLLLPDNAEEFS